MSRNNLFTEEEVKHLRGKAKVAEAYSEQLESITKLVDQLKKPEVFVRLDRREKGGTYIACTNQLGGFLATCQVSEEELEAIIDFIIVLMKGRSGEVYSALKRITFDVSQAEGLTKEFTNEQKEETQQESVEGGDTGGDRATEA